REFLFGYIYKFSINNLTTSAPPITVPNVLPKFVKSTINKMRVTLLCQNPLILNTSSDTFSKSRTLGLRMNAWTIPATIPAAINGFKDVKGAATKAEMIVSGCPKAMAAPIAENDPFQRIQLIDCLTPASKFAKKVYAIIERIRIGIAQPMYLGMFDFGGRSDKRFKSCSLLISFLIPGT